MRALNVLLAVVVSLLIGLCVLELGLRLIGLGPTHTINRFDPELGWSLEPGAVQRRKTGEFDVTFAINQLGLRDDPMDSPSKPEGVFRVLMLGDSFVQGYTVSRDDLFVDQLERLWKAEGRLVDVVNAGVEGWSTDQEVRWLQTKGRAFQPDMVVVFPYENDLWWNGRRSYLRFPKPRFQPDGQLERRELEDPGPRPWTDEWALTRLATAFGKEGPPTYEDPRTGRRLFAEWGAYFDPDPAPIAELWRESWARTRGALIALKRTCDELGAELFVVPIPNKAAVLPAARASLEKVIGGEPARWSADRPVERVLATCAELEIPTLDPRPALREAAEQGASLYYTRDWHFDPSGNRVIARWLHHALEQAGAFPPTHAKLRVADESALALGPPERGAPLWPKVFLGLWALLSVLYVVTYRDEKLWLAPLKVGGLLALVFAIVLGGKALLGLLPPQAAKLLGLTFVVAILGFVAWKLGRRLSTIAELFTCFVRRGHWYLMPLVVVLLTIGSLLVVAASSPLVAPFIYTLF